MDLKFSNAEPFAEEREAIDRRLGVPDEGGDKAFDEESFAAPVGQPFAGVTLVGA